MSYIINKKFTIKNKIEIRIIIYVMQKLYFWNSDTQFFNKYELGVIVLLNLILFYS